MQEAGSGGQSWRCAPPAYVAVAVYTPKLVCSEQGPFRAERSASLNFCDLDRRTHICGFYGPDAPLPPGFAIPDAALSQIGAVAGDANCNGRLVPMAIGLCMSLNQLEPHWVLFGTETPAPGPEGIELRAFPFGGAILTTRVPL